ncbi:histidine phosphatase family protein [Elioraea rosea]|uniref:histidine phosphatase family protein n=1 Tax=Elioraea rosea TaxID=2492390 RepID=UPI001EF4BB26|nr:histidine phosphatase family protein [Elioraea rosea]
MARAHANLTVMHLTRRMMPFMILAPVVARGEDQLWRSIRDGQTAVIMRHAIAPGTGDPPDFQADDCSTQRNLSDEGRSQARRVGALFRQNGVVSAHVLTSAWCRVRETAELLEIGSVKLEPALDSFFAKRDAGSARTEAVRAILARWSGSALVLVTHQVNITALTGVYPASGEIIFVRTHASAEVLGRVRT